MNYPTCDQCDCVAGCQANPVVCPNLLDQCIASGQVSAAQIEAHRVLDVAIAQPEQRTEQNFCARCGKRLVDDGIHTCTPPKDKP